LGIRKFRILWKSENDTYLMTDGYLWVESEIADSLHISVQSSVSPVGAIPQKPNRGLQILSSEANAGAGPGDFILSETDLSGKLRPAFRYIVSFL
jgi:hypothetical protein